MVLKRLSMRAVAGLTLWAGVGAVAQAQPPAVTVDDALRRQPRQPGVAVTTPTPDQVPRCKVDPIPNPDAKVKTPLGYVVRDPAGNPLRQFVSYDGKTYNIVAYYTDGVEAYREVYPPQSSEPYQFRWLGPNGTKWGLDKDRDGRVDEWVVISPEELSQELLQAVVTRDEKRAQALVVTKANLDALGLPAGESQKLLDKAAGAAKRSVDAADALKLAPDAKWVHLELGAPQTTPKDAFGADARDDLVVHKAGTVLVQSGKDTQFLQTGELVQVGRAWKLVDGAGGPTMAVGGTPLMTDKIRGLVEKLDEIDTKLAPAATTRELMAAYHTKRVEVLEQIVAKLTPEEQETWQRLLIDSLSGAADAEKADGKHLARLKQVRDAAKGRNAAYAAFRFLQTEHNVAVANATGSIDPVQEKWRTGLEEFVKAHPTSDEAPEAITRLALAYEHIKDGEPKAKEWYTRLAKDYARSAHAARAAGALKRLDAEGKPLELIGTNLANGQGVNVGGMKGRVVVVYYAASWSSTLKDDVKKLQALAKEYGPKGLEVVTVCLDHDPVVAARMVQTEGIPGTHLHAPGGLDASPLAASYGIQVLPHMFVVGKDGKITNRDAKAVTLEDDVKKLVQ